MHDHSDVQVVKDVDWTHFFFAIWAFRCISMALRLVPDWDMLIVVILAFIFRR